MTNDANIVDKLAVALWMQDLGGNLRAAAEQTENPVMQDMAQALIAVMEPVIKDMDRKYNPRGIFDNEDEATVAAALGDNPKNVGVDPSASGDLGVVGVVGGSND